MKKFPCGMTQRLPRFCAGRKCEGCPLNDKQDKQNDRPALPGGKEE